MVDAPFQVLPEDWEITTLGEAAQRGGGNVQTGPFGSQLHASDYVAEGVPSVMPQNIGDNRIIEEGIARIKESDAERLSKYRLASGDIVYSRRGDVERRSLVRSQNDGWLCGTGCLRVSFGKHHVLPEYAAYYLGHSAVREWIVQHAVGATMPNLNTHILSSVPFVLPPMDVQIGIATVLSALDDKIELNRRMNETLEAMAQAIFRDWFVDFGPVRRKMAGAMDPIAIMGGLMPDAARASKLAALFPDKLGEDDLPAGWREKPLDQIAEFLNGLALQKFPAQPGEPSLPVIKIAELRGGLTEKTNRASPDLPECYIIRDGDFLFSWSGSLMAKVWTEGEGALNQHLFKVSSAKYPQWFFARWVHHHMPEFQSIAASKATTMGHIQRGHLSSASAVCPPHDLLDEMSKIMGPLWQRAIHNDLENRTLAETRDYLLPRLMSGEVKMAALGDLIREVAE